MVLITDCFEYDVFFFHYKVYNKRVTGIVISSMDQTHALHSFDSDHDSSKSGFLDLITMSITVFSNVTQFDEIQSNQC